jgi:hypothetical protein
VADVRNKHDRGRPGRADSDSDGRVVLETLTPEFRKLAQNLIIEIDQSIRDQQYWRAKERLRDLSAIFVGRGPGMIEVYEERVS